ncbi:PREDICTED: uncharacterized protein LOC106747847 isoform X2 [Dinoponera quadriceps]|uniref:Uncharacterized protein LOC106747847 isoform X2 n=1 Tax=Dinoponera quadriceps TaxID=609295 RepID=A0A6P3XTQ6_DINQU|nr:PREDICTED: uncharacterized protein LOC106747847 isoform X2 [Dinoponera quadriceps]
MQLFVCMVLSITWNGEIKNGLIFIKYKTLKETLYCLESLHKSDTRILPQKDKISKPKSQRSSNKWLAGRTDSLIPKFFTDKKYNSNSTYSHKIIANTEEPTCNRKNSDYNNKSDYTSNFSHLSSLKPKHDYKPKFNLNEFELDKLNPLILNEECSQYQKQQNSDYKISSYCNQVTKQQIKFYEPLKFEENTYVNKDISTGIKIPSSSDVEIKSKGSDEKFGHSLPVSTKNTLPKSVITMQEVIVANIHTKYDVHYILHLFQKHNPISATVVKTIFQTDIRYCLVYFKKIDDALAVEKEFDKFALSGRNLIVLRKSQSNIC